MSESPQDSSATAPPPDQKSGGRSRTAFYCVLGLIGLVVAVICNDLFVAAPAVQAAFDKVADASLKAMVAEEPMSNLKVREVIGKEPSETYEDEEGHVEVFHWIGGVMGGPHDLHAVYKKKGDEFVFIRHFKSADKASASKVTVVEVDPDEPGYDEGYGEGADGPAPGEAGAPQAGGEREGGGPRGRGGAGEGGDAAGAGGDAKPDRPDLESEPEPESEDESAAETEQ